MIHATVERGKVIFCRLQEVLAERGMSRRELARKAGINKNTTCKWAKGGVALLDLATLDRICKALRIQPGEMLVWLPQEAEDA